MAGGKMITWLRSIHPWTWLRLAALGVILFFGYYLWDLREDAEAS